MLTDDTLSPASPEVPAMAESVPAVGLAEAAPDQSPIRSHGGRRLRARDRPKRPDAAGNAKPRVKYVVHGGVSALARDAIDGRTTLARHYREQLAALLAHVGNEALTHPRRELVDQGARYALLVRIAWGEVLHAGIVSEGRITPAFETFLKASREHREVLGILGLERRERPVPNLEDYLRGEPPATPEGKSPAPAEEAP
jgi:hypothetical protein